MGWKGEKKLRIRKSIYLLQNSSIWWGTGYTNHSHLLNIFGTIFPFLVLQHNTRTPTHYWPPFSSVVSVKKNVGMYININVVIANKFSNAFPYLLKGMLFIEKGDHLTNVYVWVIDFVFGQNICLDTCKVPRIIHTYSSQKCATTILFF